MLIILKMKHSSTLRLGIAAFVLAAWALAEGFTFTIGNPVASQDFRFKSAAFALRTEGCAEPAEITDQRYRRRDGERRAAVGCS